ncbi:hypothetical protein AIOL_001442 [Candidatus Rhodobacter oscarellae]|uniref:Tetratricopeptide repeat protein n=1 Tax=Candidatus Rhodobacter oscarellae TaxID=1675527 RepID=A0A0J9GSK5_9RHOB|nr:hypothetical protein [Candidatus Rhodobacter lobularis]KMW56488.1 hypothetical protein AIOL_001442 [Candidatus Rhodobacter lobularis]
MTLDASLRAAHETGDKEKLVELYTAAADAAEDVDQECFFLTHAYVFALDADDPRAQALRARLIDHGRES